MTTRQGSFFKTSAFAALTIGVPFCVFKGLFGFLLVDNKYAVIGAACIAWAVADCAMNLVRAGMELAGARDSSLQFCLLGQLGARFGRRDLLMAMDTLLAFAIICGVLWSGWIAQLPPWGHALWLGATTVNLMSLAIMHVWLEIARGARSDES